MRAAVYNGTRNLYEDMLTAAKSLLVHSNVEKIYFLIEDDEFPYELPPEIECINVSNQQYFSPNGPNFNSFWTYMVLVRVALSKIFLDLDTILSLDVDTIVNENISNLWDINLDGYYYAAVDEPIKNKDNFISINAGVMLINLKQLREDKKDDELIEALNTQYYKFPEQDCISALCQRHLLVLPPDYNMNDSVDYKKAKARKIIHYAGNRSWTKYPLVKKYRELPLNKIVRNQYPDQRLDIIIPSYNNLEGLRNTLHSIYQPLFVTDWIDVTVVDDASDLNYTSILQEFPLIHLIKLEQNDGPGHARKVGIQNTHNAYIMFVDCGDIILSKYCFYAIQEQLSTNRVVDLYVWPWINEDGGRVSGFRDASTPGKIYKREFLEVYNLYPYDHGAGSYAAEDCGLNLSCYAIMEDYTYDDDTPHMAQFELPIYKTRTDKNSLTYKNNKEFWVNCLPGIVDNAIYCIHNCEYANIHTEIILDRINLFLIDLYKIFLQCTKKKPEYLEDYWQRIRQFYFQVYKKYENEPGNETQQMLYQSSRLQSLRKYIARPNFKRFIYELNTNDQVPENYYLNYLT